MRITINLDRFPAFLDLEDPERTVLSILDTQHAIFKTQKSSLPTKSLSDSIHGVLDSIRDANSMSVSDIRATNEKVASSVRDMQSTSDIVRLKMGDLTGVGETMKYSISELRSSLSEFKSVHETMKQLPVLLAKSQSKGTVGEKCTFDFLMDAFSGSDFLIEKTSSTAHSGDMLITKRDFACVVDSKYYKHSVPRKEIEKLKRDMLETSTRCGVLVSLTSGVSGCKPVDMDVYMNEKSEQCCVVILSHVRDAPDRVTVCIKLLDVIWEFFLKKADVSMSSLAHRDRSIQFLSSIMESFDEIRRLVRTFEQHRKTITDSLSGFYEEMVRTIDLHGVRIQERLATFQTLQ